jgi:hypothetical protein
MKPALFFAIAAAVLLSCTTIDMSTYEDGNIYAELETNDPKQVVLMVDNRSSGEVSLDQNSASYTRFNQDARLTAVTETQSGAAVPQLIVPVRTRKSRSFATEQSVTSKNGKLVLNAWVPTEIADDSSFTFSYRIGEETFPISFPDTQERTIVGKVKVSLDIAMPFFYRIPERRQKIYDRAIAQAKESFGANGKKLQLVNLRYDSKSTIFVENATLSADVIALD